MGTRNRDRRRRKEAQRKQAQRSRSGATYGSGRARAASHLHGVDETIAMVIAGASDRGAEPSSREKFFTALVDGRFPRARVTSSIEDCVSRLSLGLLEHGWEPADIAKAVRRKENAAAVALLAGLLPDAVRMTTKAEYLERRQAEAANLAQSSGRRLGGGSPDWASHVRAVLAAVGVLVQLPRLRDLGLVRSAAHAARPGIDEPLLARVRALLAQAESTSFEEEAAAFMAKAQELMTRYRIDRAVVEADRAQQGGAPVIDARRCWLDDPYLSLESYLLSVVARANQVRAVAADKIGFVTLVGHPADVDATEILFTSLLVQATRRMAEITAAGQPAGLGLFLAVRRQSARPSYRRSFFVGFANRIGDRLEEAAGASSAAAVSELGETFLPVLARRAGTVDEAVGKLFGDLVIEQVGVTDHRGWAAGAAAADLADLAVGPVLAGTGAQ